jgi:hypothetical protein
MNDDDFGRDLAARLGRLVEDEPPFVTDLGDALQAAERDGRRRRVRVRAVRGGGALLAVAATAVLATVVNQFTIDKAIAPSFTEITQDSSPPVVTPSTSGPTPTAPIAPTSPASGVPVSTKPASTAPVSVAPTSKAPARPKGTTVTRPPASSLLVGLEALVRDIAAPAQGSVDVTKRVTGPGTDYDEPTSVTAHVTTAAGRFVVSAALPTDDGSLDSWRSACADEGEACRELFFTAKAGAWETSPEYRPGEKMVRLKAVGAPGGGLLSIFIDNITDGADGKLIGPSWEAAGLDEASLRSSVDDYLAEAGGSSS